MRHILTALAAYIAVLLLALAGCQDPSELAEVRTSPYEPSNLAKSRLEVFHEFRGPIPTGVTVSHEGRVFVTFPRWEDPVTATLVEIDNGKEIPFPNSEINRGDTPDSFLSIQSAVVDPKNRLWAVDCGSVDMGPIKGYEWPKIVCIDLATNQVTKTIRFGEGVIHRHSFINDIRFDLKRGTAGYAFLTDASANGPNGIIVVDLATGRSWRKLHEHVSVKADPEFSAVLEGEPLSIRKPMAPPKALTVGSDGIAISRDGERLFYCPLSSRRLHSVSTDALVNENLEPKEVEETVRGEMRKFASDGLESDRSGRIYLTDFEHNAIQVRTDDNDYETLVEDPRLLWPDTLSLSTDGYLYIIANQLHRQPKFHNGQDKRQRPFHLLRIKVDAKPVLLR
jgi:sugar lactone lactonase YvrE